MALLQGRAIDPQWCVHVTHRYIADALAVVDLRGDVEARVGRVAEELRRRRRWATGYTYLVSWSDLSGCIVAAELAEPAVRRMAVDELRDQARRRRKIGALMEQIERLRRGQIAA